MACDHYLVADVLSPALRNHCEHPPVPLAGGSPVLMTHLSFCTNETRHLCDRNTLIRLSCPNTQLGEMLVLALGSSVVLMPFVCITAPCTPIAVAARRVASARGKWKALSTCGCQRCVIALFYGTVIGVYLNPASSRAAQRAVTASGMHIMATPTLTHSSTACAAQTPGNFSAGPALLSSLFNGSF